MADELKQPMIRLVANVVHAKDAVIVAAEALRDRARDSPQTFSQVWDLAIAVDALRAAKKAAGL